MPEALIVVADKWFSGELGLKETQDRPSGKKEPAVLRIEHGSFHILMLNQIKWKTSLRDIVVAEIKRTDAQSVRVAGHWDECFGNEFREGSERSNSSGEEPLQIRIPECEEESKACLQAVESFDIRVVGFHHEGAEGDFFPSLQDFNSQLGLAKEKGDSDAIWLKVAADVEILKQEFDKVLTIEQLAARDKQQNGPLVFIHDVIKALARPKGTLELAEMMFDKDAEEAIARYRKAVDAFEDSIVEIRRLCSKWDKDLNKGPRKPLDKLLARCAEPPVWHAIALEAPTKENVTYDTDEFQDWFEEVREILEIIRPTKPS